MRGVTLSDITHAADQLLADGERPTIEGVRRILGTGSPATVNSLLKQYFQALPARLNLPAPIATAAAELYEKVRSTALDDLNAQRAEQESAFGEQQARLAQERRDLEAERTSAQQRVVDLVTDIERTREQLKTTTAKLAVTEKELSAQTTRASTAEAQFKAAEQERERSGQKHVAELQRLKDQTEGNERHFLGRIEEQKAQVHRLTQDRERETAAVAKQISSLETSISEASKVHASLRAELATLQRELTKREESVSAAEIALARAQEQASKDQSARQADVERFKGETEALTASSERHKRDRDEALREAAKLEGRLAALQLQLDESKAEVGRLQKGK